MATARAELLSTAPDRAAPIAAAAVALTALVAMVNARFGEEWGQGIHLVYTAAAALLVIGLAANSPVPAEGERPATWQSVLFVTSFVLAFGTLTNLADVLGADDPPLGASGTVVWIGLLLMGLTGWFARGWNSGISTLLFTVTFGTVIVFFVDWVFSPEDVDTFRWVLLLVAIGFAAVAGARRGGEPDHAVGFMNAAGLALLALALTFLGQAVLGVAFDPEGTFGFGVGWGWELAVLGGSAALIAWSVVTRQAGPGYLGAANLIAYIYLAAGPGEDGPSLVGWPLVLIVVTGALLFMALGGRGAPAASSEPRG